MRLITRLATTLIGFISIWTGLYGWANFNPPVHADPGAVNACYLTFAWMILVGPLFIWASTWRLVQKNK